MNRSDRKYLFFAVILLAGILYLLKWRWEDERSLLWLAGAVILAMSTLTYYLFRVDKKKATQQQPRIAEHTLWLFSFFGGACGASTLR